MDSNYPPHATLVLAKIQVSNMDLIKVSEPIVFEDQKIRRTVHGDVSVFDLISVVGGQVNPRTVWKRLSNRYSEVVAQTYNLKFPGAGQRETPVIGKEGALQILGLLPGEVGNRYRVEAAQLIIAWYENPAELAMRAIDRIDNAQDSKDVLEKAAEKYLTTYHPLFEKLKEVGADQNCFINVNRLNTKAVLGAEPKEVVAERGGQTARSKLSASEYGSFSVLQDCQLSNMERKEVGSAKEAYAAGKEVAVDFQTFLNKWKAD